MREKLLFWFSFTYSDTAFQDRMIWLLHSLPKSKRGRLIDYGCGKGDAVNLATSRGWKALGLSFDSEMLEYAKRLSKKVGQKGSNFLLVDLRDLDEILKKGHTCDVALCLEVIEHIKDDQLLINKICSRLHEGGLLYLSTPNKFYRPLVGDSISDSEDGGHVRWGYTFSELNKICYKAGLRIIEKGQFTGVVSQMLINFQRICTKFFGNRWAFVINYPFRVLLPLDRLFSYIIGYKFLSLYIIAVKK